MKNLPGMYALEQKDNKSSNLFNEYITSNTLYK